MARKSDGQKASDYYLGLQLSANIRSSDILLTALCAALIVGLGVFIYSRTPRTFSEEENRSLAAFPKPRIEEIASGDFSKQLSLFYTDQFPARAAFTALKAKSELLLGKRENNGVIPADDGYLIVRPDYNDTSVLEDNIAALEKYARMKRESGCKVCIAIAPRSIDVMTSKLPKLYPYSPDAKIWDLCGEALTFTDELRKSADSGETVWYKTDHHWTTTGAYYAYRLISEEFGITAYPLEYFSHECATSDFVGTTASKLGMSTEFTDIIELFRYDGDTDYEITYISGKTERKADSFYDLTALSGKDKYAVFLGGNHEYIKVRKNGSEPRRRLLVIKDSFANSVIPFLALHFDLDIVDLRCVKYDPSRITESDDFDDILILYGIDTLATDASPTALAGK